MEASQIERPLCECHGEPMGWSRDKRMVPGGYWLCAVSKREAVRAWRHAHPERAREYRRRWEIANPDKAREQKRRKERRRWDNMPWIKRHELQLKQRRTMALRRMAARNARGRELSNG